MDAQLKYAGRVALVVGLAVLALSTYLVGKGRDELGIQLITLVAGIVTAAFGGYGYAVSRKRAENDESGL